MGSLLVWATATEGAHARGDQALAAGVVKLLLDGQQRITSLYGLVRGRPPAFFDGDHNAFTGLHFQLEREEFAFYSPIKMKDDPLWVDVTLLMQEGLAPFFERLGGAAAGQYFGRLNAVHNILQRDFHIEEVTGEDKTLDVVVDIFNRVNSGGRTLSEGDLALARVCARWPQARDRMKEVLAKWKHAGFHFQKDWLLRNVTTVATGEARFRALHDLPGETFQLGLADAERAVDTLLNLLGSRLGLDSSRVLFGKYAIPVMAHYLHHRGSRFGDARERDKLLFWYLHVAMWGRFSGSAESEMDKALKILEELDGGLDRLLEELRLWRGDLRVKPGHFGGSSSGDRFFNVLYLLSRVRQARDWGSGIALRDGLLGRRSQLQRHHIFPKASLYKAGFSKGEVNAVANMCFQTAETNLAISDSNPAVYLAEIEDRFPGVLESQWIPMDRELWAFERYLDFLTERRALLAQAANGFLDELLQADAAPEDAQFEASFEVSEATIPGGIAGDEEEAELLACNRWVAAHGLPEGQLLFELTEGDGQPVALLDLAWPTGLQAGLSEPVALLLDESARTLAVASAHHYLFFTDVESFKHYVLDDILGSEAGLSLSFLQAYDVLEELAGGGMARVFRVAERGTDRVLFLKAVHLSDNHDTLALKREAAIYTRLQRLECASVLEIIDCRQDGEHMVLVTEYADGGNLAEYVEANPAGRLSPAEAQKVGMQIASGLQGLHAADIVHRDLKPQNVVRNGERWMLTDFGIAKNRSRLITQFTFQQAGTPGYSAPEQMDGVEARPAADVYSLGKLLAFLLTGQTDVDRVSFHSWAHLIRRCTARRPDDRPALDEVIRELSRIPA